MGFKLMGIKPENYQKMRAALTKLMGGKCLYCGSKDNLEFDHIKPSKIMMRDMSRSKREWHWFDEIVNNNLQLLCHDCNRKKSDSYPIYYITTTARL